MCSAWRFYLSVYFDFLPLRDHAVSPTLAGWPEGTMARAYVNEPAPRWADTLRSLGLVPARPAHIGCIRCGPIRATYKAGVLRRYTGHGLHSPHGRSVRSATISRTCRRPSVLNCSRELLE